MNRKQKHTNLPMIVMNELNQTVWHRGLDNNRTQFLGAIFCYQLLLRYNRRCGNKNGQIQWILDTL